MTSASIVIVTYGQRALTEQCLNSLQAALGDRLGRDWELVLVDNNSPDDTPKLLSAWSDRARVVLLKENRNFAGGCNLGAQVANGATLVFLNNDTEVPPGALETLVEQAREPGVGAVGCRLLYPNRTIQHAGVAFIAGTIADRPPMPHHVLTGYDHRFAISQGVFETDCVTAACTVIPTPVFRELSGYDESFVNGLEDVDLCLRIRAAGHTIIYRGDVTLIHHEGASRGRTRELWTDPEKVKISLHNDELLEGRWRELLEQDDELALTAWDAELEDPAQVPPRTESDAELAIVGNPAGLGPAAEEARAFLTSWANRGHRVAAYNEPQIRLRARLRGDAALNLALARMRPAAAGAPLLYVPIGSLDPTYTCEQTVRVGFLPSTRELAHAREVWAPCRAVADALLADGLEPCLARVVPPPITPGSQGQGGGGVLVVLPVHDRDASTKLLQALKRTRPGTELKILPTTFVRGLDAEIQGCLPGAELLAPCSGEDRFSELAAAMDVVVAADNSDPFERRALVAASAGAAVFTLRRDGPAVEALGDAAAITPLDLATAVDAALVDSRESRHERAELVTEHCAQRAPELVSHGGYSVTR